MDFKDPDINENQKQTMKVDESQFGAPASSAEKDSLVGTVFAGKYEICQQIGEGGMSVVYKAYDKLLNRNVAIKLLTETRLRDDKSRARFKQEARATARLNHPNIVRVHEFEFGDDSPPYLVMDYIEGTPLSDLIVMEGRIGPNRTVEIALQVVSALDQAHSFGVVHRDLKPSNIIVSKSDDGKDHAFVVDFGIAKLLPQDGLGVTQLTQTGEVFGSPLYMSPEQCMGSSMDGRSDIYSFGCVLYEMLTGRPPFVGENPVHTVMKQLHDDPLPFKKVRSDTQIPQALERLVMSCLAKKPGERYDSAALLKADLLKLVQGKTIDARNQGWANSVRKGVRRTDPLVASIAVALVLALSGAILVISSIMRPVEETKLKTMGFDNKFKLDMNSQAKEDLEREPYAIIRVYHTPDFTDEGMKYVSKMKRLQQLDLRGTNITGAGLKLLSGLPIEQLDISGTEIDDQALACLNKLPRLSLLNLRQTDITDEGVRHISELGNLSELRLGGTRVTDNGIKELSKLSRVDYLDLGGTPITDRSCQTLSEMPMLRFLNLSGTAVTDGGVAALNRLPQLLTLDLSRTRITDEGVAELSKMANLSTLELSQTRITGRSIDYLMKMKHLTLLDLSGCRISRRALGELRAHLPLCKINGLR